MLAQKAIEAGTCPLEAVEELKPIMQAASCQKVLGGWEI